MKYVLSILVALLAATTDVHAFKQADFDELEATGNRPDCYLTGTVINRVDLSGADLINARLIDAELKDANHEGAALGDASLRKAVLSGVSLKDVDRLTQDQLAEACGNKKAVLPKSLSIRLCPVDADLERCS